MSTPETDKRDVNEVKKGSAIGKGKGALHFPEKASPEACFPRGVSKAKGLKAAGISTVPLVKREAGAGLREVRADVRGDIDSARSTETSETTPKTPEEARGDMVSALSTETSDVASVGVTSIPGSSGKQNIVRKEEMMESGVLKTLPMKTGGNAKESGTLASETNTRHGPNRRVWRASDESPRAPYDKDSGKCRGKSSHSNGNVASAQKEYQKGKGKCSSAGATGADSGAGPRWNVWEKKGQAEKLFSSVARAGGAMDSTDKSAQAVSKKARAEGSAVTELKKPTEKSKGSVKRDSHDSNSSKGLTALTERGSRAQGENDSRSEGRESKNERAQNSECKSTRFENVTACQSSSSSSKDADDFGTECSFLGVGQGKFKEGKSG